MLVSELLAAALDRDEEPPRPFHWHSQPMRALVDLEDKEAVRMVLDGT